MRYAELSGRFLLSNQCFWQILRVLSRLRYKSPQLVTVCDQKQHFVPHETHINYRDKQEKSRTIHSAKGIWHQLPVCNWITSQFICHDLPGLATVKL